MKTRDEYNQDQLEFINGYAIRLTRRPELDTVYHAYYQFSLDKPSSWEAPLFGNPWDTVGIPKAYKDRRSPSEACILAFSSATLSEEDTDAEFFAKDSPEVTTWRRSWEREELASYVSRRQEAIDNQ